MLEKWIIHEPSQMGKILDPVGAILVLPGRGISGSLMEKFMHHTGLWRSLQVTLEPEDFQWYPQPNGMFDQAEAVAGLAKARDVLENAVNKIRKGWGVKKNKIGIVGFSAGAVMGLQMVAHSSDPYAGVLSLAGAILDPDALPKAKNKTPIMLQHNVDDDCFKWWERYLPMKVALTKQGYNVDFHERDEGGHNLSYADVKLARRFFSGIFGYAQDFERIEEEEAAAERQAAEESEDDYQRQNEY